MKLLWTLTALALLARPACADVSPEEAQAVGARIGAFTTAWNAQDPQALSALFADDADILDPLGNAAKGRSEIESLFAEAQSGPLRNSRLEITAGDIRPLNTHSFFADLEGTLSWVGGADGKPQMAAFHAGVVIEGKPGEMRFLSARAFTFPTAGQAPPEAPAAAAPEAASSAPAAYTAPEGGSRKETEGIGTLAYTFVGAYNAHDAKAMASLFDEGADMIDAQGAAATGPAGIERLFAEEHAGPLKGSTLAIRLGDVRKVVENLFFVDIEGQVSSAAGPEGSSSDQNIRCAALVEEQSGRFLFLNARFFSLLPAPPAP